MSNRRLSQAEIDKSLADLRQAANIGGLTWDTFYKEYSGAKFRLEFPLGELATNNPDLQGCWFAAKSLGQVSEALPITGSEGFTAQGLEGKCSIEGYGTQLLTVYDTLPAGRRALYRVKVGRSKQIQERNFASTHNIDLAYARACDGHCADCGATPDECISRPCKYAAMVLRYLPVNQAWVFLFGTDIETATIQPMGDYGRFFSSRKDAVSAAKSCGITVAKNGKCEVTKMRDILAQLYVHELKDELQFISDSQDVQPIKEALGTNAAEFDSFFVAIQDGEYTEVYGMHGIIPLRSKPVWRILPHEALRPIKQREINSV